MLAIPYADWSDYNLCPSDMVCKSTQMVVHKKSRDDWKIEQENDPIIGPVIEAIQPKLVTPQGLVMKAEDCFETEVICYFIAGYCIGKYSMVNNKKINSSLSYPNPTGNNL